MKRLHTDHYADLRKSGLTDQTIEQAAIKSLRPDEIAKVPGCNHRFIKSMYEIPYPGCNGFSRYRVFYKDGYTLTNGKKPAKYLQNEGSGNHLYIPESINTILKDAAVPIYITEGEKKALKACQEGLNCIGLSGLWNWSAGNRSKRIIICWIVKCWPIYAWIQFGPVVECIYWEG